MLEIIFIIAFALYFIQTFIFIVGIRKKFPVLTDEHLPSVTIIVAARNEEKNIIDCLNSLKLLEYPESKIEIIMVDDNSTDGTAQLIKEFVKDDDRFKYLLADKSFGTVKGKARAIANGIEQSKNEIIMTTDADCSVNPKWVYSMAKYFQDDVAIVCGYTSQSSEKLFSTIQSADFMYLLGVAAGAMNLGKPLSCIGNNMAYRKSVYNQIGGYEAIPFSVTEDFQLLMTVHKLKSYKVIYPLDPGNLVVSKPCPDIKSLFWQKKRWAVGGMNSEIAGFSVMASAFVLHGFIIFGLPVATSSMIALMVSKVMLDYLLLKPIFKKYSLNLGLKNFLAFELYFIFYVFLLPFTLLFGTKIKWKGREY
ncbi:MAG: glycosyltransferase [Melioribacteraceae bacterium]|nr:glycosyltransferase [Melioribacteraceae bacterium]MCF8265799.1 glycosyltransferase [Melioribacteraceae bacterium]MCF8412124.1 glycosyltransferase [Melioribacteraceae bacterium]MCF8431303.1 glycosyltransferase [Melioribacteraceae bacterium]